MLECDGIKPLKGIYAHISGIDLVQAKDGHWYVLEDNLRIPSGASYPMIARERLPEKFTDTFNENMLEDNRNYAKLLRRTYGLCQCRRTHCHPNTGKI